MRYFIHLITASISLGVATSSIAAPLSMLQRPNPDAGNSVIVQEVAPQAAEEETSRFGWLNPWSKKASAEVVAPAVESAPSVALPPQAVYQAPTQPAPSTPVVVPSQSVATIPTAPAQQSATGSTTCRELRDQGHESDRLGNLGEAERFYRLAIAADPTSAAAVNDLALCLARQGQLDSSAKTFMKAIGMRPDKPLYRNNIATVLVEMNLIEDAKSHLLTVYSPSTASYNLGHLLNNRGKKEEAVRQFQAAIAEDPTFAPAQEMIASLSPMKLPEYRPTVASTPQPTMAETVTQTATQPFIPQVAQAATPQIPTLAPAEAPGTQPYEEATTATPSFPRLLPPVINR